MEAFNANSKATEKIISLGHLKHRLQGQTNGRWYLFPESSHRLSETCLSYTSWMFGRSSCPILAYFGYGSTVPRSTIRYREIDGDRWIRLNHLYDSTAGFLLLDFLMCAFYGILPGGYISLGWWVGFSSSQSSGSVIRISLQKSFFCVRSLDAEMLSKVPKTEVHGKPKSKFVILECSVCVSCRSWCRLETLGMVVPGRTRYPWHEQFCALFAVRTT